METHICKKVCNLTLVVILLLNGSLMLRSQGFSPETVKRLQKVLETFQNDPQNPVVGGISAAIKVDGLAFWQGATGYAARNIDEQNNLLPGGTPFTPQTLTHIYSVTKTFTAALVLELAKEGAFSLDDLITNYIPVKAINPALDDQVTIKQLLAHESGYSNFTDEIQLQIAVAAFPSKVWTPYEALSFVHQANPPGAVRRYSSTNYILLGTIIELATGKPVEQHYRERFFDPLGLRSTYLSVREPLGGRGVLAAPHDNISQLNPVFMQTGQPTFPDTYTNISRLPFTAISSLSFTSGGIVSNAADVAHWGSALFGGRATSWSTLHKMLNSISDTPDPDGDRLGYGIFITPRISQTELFIGHDGVSPGYRALMFHQPEKKLTLVVLTNYRYQSRDDFYAIARALYEALPDITCGSENWFSDNVKVCFLGRNICVPRHLGAYFVLKGAYLGACDLPSQENIPGWHKPWEVRNKMAVYPNPSNNRTTISFTVDVGGPVSLIIYDMSGRAVNVLFRGTMDKGGMKQVEMNTGTLSTGIYYARLQTPSGTSEQKLVISR